MDATNTAATETSWTLLSAAGRLLTVRSARTGRVRTYRTYRDGHWEMVRQ